MKKVLASIAAFVVVGFVPTTTFVYADSSDLIPTSSTSTSPIISTKSGTSSVVLVGQKDQIVRTYSSGEKLSDALENDGQDITDYRTSDDSPLDGDLILESSEVYVFYENGVTAKSKTIDLDFMKVTQKTDSLYKGQEEKISDGEPGKAVETTVLTQRKSGEKTSEETLSVIKAPINQVTLVGTKELPIPVDYSGGIFYRNDKKILDYALTINSDPDVRLALKQVGKPYVWANEGPNSFDCSGLIYYVYAINKGLEIPRTANTIGNFSKQIDWTDLKPGDVVWSPTHITMYIGNGLVVHAANHRVGVVISPLSYFMNHGFKPARIPNAD